MATYQHFLNDCRGSRGLSIAKRRQERPKRRQERPREPQELPKRRQEPPRGTKKPPETILPRFWTHFSPPGTSKNLKSAVLYANLVVFVFFRRRLKKTPKKLPTEPNRTPKSRPRGPRSGSRGPQEAPGASQEAAKSSQERPRRVPRGTLGA